MIGNRRQRDQEQRWHDELLRQVRPVYGLVDFNHATEVRRVRAMSFVGALAIAAVAIFMAAKPAAAEQCWPTVLPSPDPTPLDRPKPPKPKCDFPAGVKNHEMAGLYLYDTECEHKPSPLLTRLSAEFRKLPDDLRAIAL